MFIAVAFASMDAGAEHTTATDGGSADLAGSKYLPGTYLRRATAVNTEFMSGAVVMGRIHLLWLASNNLIDKLMGQQCFEDIVLKALP